MLEQYDNTLQNWIESIVKQGDDDALFASGYLQGHFAVVLSQLEEEADQSLLALENKMQACLATANEELEDADFALVNQAWLALQAELENA